MVAEVIEVELLLASFVSVMFHLAVDGRYTVAENAGSEANTEGF
jgi:hypothetical protein